MATTYDTAQQYSLIRTATDEQIAVLAAAHLAGIDTGLGLTVVASWDDPLTVYAGLNQPAYSISGWDGRLPEPLRMTFRAARAAYRRLTQNTMYSRPDKGWAHLAAENEGAGDAARYDAAVAALRAAALAALESSLGLVCT